MPSTPDPSPGAPLPAYILAGGRSVRFGSDKARAMINGQPLIAHIARSLREILAPVTVVARERNHYADLGLTTIADAAADNGPVQGLLAALIHRLEQGPGWLLLAACDMLTDNSVPFRTLLDALPEAPDACRAVAFRTNRWQPMPGLYHTDLLPAVAAFLADGRRAFQDLLQHPHLATFAPHTRTDPLARLVHANTPDELRAGLRHRDSPPPPRSAEST